jgi:hypothetical protein
MRQLRLRGLTHFALLAASACTFQSLDYLNAGNPTREDSGEGPVAAGGIGSSSDGGAAGVATTAQGGSETQATGAEEKEGAETLAPALVVPSRSFQVASTSSATSTKAT